MRSLRVSENIVPVSEFKARTAEWFRRLGRSSAPVVITQNGRAAGVLLSPTAYDELIEGRQFMDAVRNGLDDIQSGRVTAHREVITEMNRRFGGPDRE